jgi:hypothetical protein
MGRFISPDPVGGNFNNPQSLNRYSYVMNSPLALIDPTGFQSCTVDGASTNCGVAAKVLNIGGTHSGIAADVCNFTTCGLYRYISLSATENEFFNMAPRGTSFNPEEQITAGQFRDGTYFLGYSRFPLEHVKPSDDLLPFNFLSNVGVGAAGFFAGGSRFAARFSTYNTPGGGRPFKVSPDPPARPAGDPAPTDEDLWGEDVMKRKEILDSVGEWAAGVSEGLTDFIFTATPLNSCSGKPRCVPGT